MNNFFKKYKWIINWAVFGLLLVAFIVFAVLFEEKNWIGNVLQTIGTIAGVYLTLIIFLQSKEDSDKQFREHIEHLTQLNQNQINELQTSTKTQIEAFQELNVNQIKALHESTEKQIIALQKETEKHIEALQKLTYEEISSFEKQISDVTNKLAENSILLAEILGRELEKAIVQYENAINVETAKYQDLTRFKFLRTPQQKEQQLQNQKSRIDKIKQGWEYLVEKYNQVQKFLNPEQNLLEKQ